MPLFAPILRGTLILSSVTLAISYTLYENNPQFRAFVDAAVDRILAAWDHVLANFSPEERQRQRDAQRRDVLLALSSGRPADTVPSVFEKDRAIAVSGTDVAASSNEVEDAARTRRRRLWDIAEKNAIELRGFVEAGISDLERRVGGGASFTPREPEAVAPPPPPPPPPQETDLERSMRAYISQAERGSLAEGVALSSHPTDDAGDAKDPEEDMLSVSGASMASSYDQILTPTSPSVQSVASDAEYPFPSSASRSLYQSMSDNQTGDFHVHDHADGDDAESVRSASTETMSMSHVSQLSHQSAPPSVVGSETDDVVSLADMSDEGELRDPTDEVAWREILEGAREGRSR